MDLQWWCFAQQTAWSWTWRPLIGVWITLGLMTLGYRRVRSRIDDGTECPQAGRWRTVAFGSTLFLLWASLDWPLGPLGAGYLASVHMVQFLAVGVAAPALLLLALPPAAFERFRSRPRALAFLEAVTQPVAAFCIFNVGMTVSHWPGVVDSLMRTQTGSFLLDLAWFAAGLVFWWPVIAPIPERPGFHPMGKIAYLALNAFLIRPPFAMMIFSEHPIYAIYELAPPVVDDPLDDQQLAGAIMKIGLAWVMLTAVVVVFQRWRRQEAEV